MAGYLCGSPAYFAAHGIPKSPADLKHLAVIAFEGLIAFHPFARRPLLYAAAVQIPNGSAVTF